MNREMLENHSFSVTSSFNVLVFGVLGRKISETLPVLLGAETFFLWNKGEKPTGVEEGVGDLGPF